MAGLLKTEAEMRAAIKSLDSYTLIGLDTETDGLHGPMCGFSFGINEKLGWYVPIRHRTLFDYEQPSLELIKEVFMPFFMSDSKVFLGHNIGYDLMTFWRDGMDIRNVEDSQLLGWLLDENQARALKQRAIDEGVADSAIKFGSLLGKQKSLADIPASSVADYAIQDISLPFRLYKKFVARLRSEYPEMLKHYYAIELPFLRLLAEMTHEGILVDQQALKEAKDDLSGKLHKLKLEIFEECGEYFNISSKPQLGRILYQKMQIPCPVFTEKGAPSVAKEALEKIKKDGYKIGEMLISYSETEKFLTSFTDSILEKLDEHGKVHASLNQTGTVTGRLTCNAPNLQQVPRESKFRSAFIAPDDEVLVIADYSQLELRVLCHFSQDEVMLHAFENNLDLHALGASKIFGVSLEEVMAEDKDPTVANSMRSKAKTVNFKIVYGGGTDLEKGITKEFLQAWYRIHHGAKSFIDSHKKYMLQTGGITYTISGRHRTDWRVLSKEKSPDGEPLANIAQRGLFSAIIQGSASDLVKKAMLDVDAHLKRNFPTAKLLLQVHDELITRCKKKDAEAVAAAKKDLMENVWPGLRVPLKVDPGIGKNWASKK